MTTALRILAAEAEATQRPRDSVEGAMQRRGTSILALILALGALPAPALALRRAAHAHAFASCARLVHYERTHFAITHGVPEASPRPLTEPSLAASSPSVRAPQV